MSVFNDCAKFDSFTLKGLIIEIEGVEMKNVGFQCVIHGLAKMGYCANFVILCCDIYQTWAGRKPMQKNTFRLFFQAIGWIQ